MGQKDTLDIHSFLKCKWSCTSSRTFLLQQVGQCQLWNHSAILLKDNVKAHPRTFNIDKRENKSAVSDREQTRQQRLVTSLITSRSRRKQCVKRRRSFIGLARHPTRLFPTPIRVGSENQLLSMPQSYLCFVDNKGPQRETTVIRQLRIRLASVFPWK